MLREVRMGCHVLGTQSYAHMQHDPQMAKLAMQVKDKRGNRVVEENET